MGAIITVTVTSNDPSIQAKIQAIAAKIQQATGEAVSVDVGLTNNQSMPGSIAINKMLTDQKPGDNIRI